MVHLFQAPKQESEISYDNLLYCKNCIKRPGPKNPNFKGFVKPTLVWEQGEEPKHIRRTHKVRCGCEQRFWKLAEWERHRVEKRWENRMECHSLQCEKCCKLLFINTQNFLEIFTPLLEQEAAEADGKHRAADEKESLAATNPDAESSSSTNFYLDPVEENGSSKDLGSFEEADHIKKDLGDYKYRYAPNKEYLLAGPAPGRGDEALLKNYLQAHPLNSAENETLGKKQLEKRKLPDFEIDISEFDIDSNSKRIKADPLEMIDM